MDKIITVVILISIILIIDFVIKKNKKRLSRFRIQNKKWIRNSFVINQINESVCNFNVQLEIEALIKTNCNWRIAILK